MLRVCQPKALSRSAASNQTYFVQLTSKAMENGPFMKIDLPIYLTWWFSNMLVYWRVPQQRMRAPPSLSSAGISPAVVSSLGMDGHGIGKGSVAGNEWVERINGPSPKRIWSKDKSRDSFYPDHIIIMHLHIAIRNHTHVRYLFVCLAKSKMLSIFANMYIKGGGERIWMDLP